MKTPLHLPAGMRPESGSRFWKSLEEFSESPEFLPYLHREFPEYASEWDRGMDRRRFLRLIGASLAMAGLASCSRQPPEKIVPYVRQPAEFTPAVPLYYATTFPDAGYGKGVLVRSDMGRPTKIEGNPDHPASLGACDLFMQASVLSLYDPDRSQLVRSGTEISNWDSFVQFARGRMEDHRQDQGAGLFILTGKNTSPTLLSQLQQMRAQFPRMTWCEAHPTEPMRATASTGQPAEPLFDFSQAEVIVSLDADFLFQGPANLSNTKTFSQKRRQLGVGFSRLYVIETTPTVTGAKADVRWRRKPTEIIAIANELWGAIAQATHASPEVQRLAEELMAQRGKSLVVAGDYQPAEVHFLAYRINQVLGNIGTTVRYLEAGAPIIPMTSIADFMQGLRSGGATTLVIADANPVYDLPDDLHFAEAVGKVVHSIHLGLYDDETGTLCQWHLPGKHYLEAWGDILALDGTPSLIQPLIEPLYEDAASIQELFSVFVDTPPQRGYDLIHNFWLSRFSSEPENSWNRSLNKGVLLGLRPEALPLPVSVTEVIQPPVTRASAGKLEIIFRPDASVGDGREANHSWLQELPRPMTKLTWDNAALISPKSAAQLGLKQGDLVKIAVQERTVNAPIWIQPGQADDTLALHLGYGRWRAGEIGSGVGFNVNPLRSSEELWMADGATIQAIGGTHRFATTQNHFSMEGRGLIQVQTLAETQASPAEAKFNSPAPGPQESLYPAYAYKDYAWAMSIDLRFVYRLQRLHRGLSGGEQHPRGRQGAGDLRPGNALDPGGPLFPGRTR